MQASKFVEQLLAGGSSKRWASLNALWGQHAPLKDGKKVLVSLTIPCCGEGT